MVRMSIKEKFMDIIVPCFTVTDKRDRTPAYYSFLDSIDCFDAREAELVLKGWCQDNFKEFDFIDFEQFGYVIFDNEEDAVGFKLRWL